MERLKREGREFLKFRVPPPPLLVAYLDQNIKSKQQRLRTNYLNVEDISSESTTAPTAIIEAASSAAASTDSGDMRATVPSAESDEEDAVAGIAGRALMGSRNSVDCSKHLGFVGFLDNGQGQKTTMNVSCSLVVFSDNTGTLPPVPRVSRLGALNPQPFSF